MGTPNETRDPSEAQMRKRKRDWPVRVYKFWARPLELPQALWDTARAMQALWNRLVALYDDERFIEETLCGGQVDVGSLRKQADAAALRQVAESGLNWETGPDVLDRFRAARVRAFRAMKNGESPARAGLPQVAHRIENIAISHRFTGGGMPVQRLFSERAHRFALVPVAPEAYEGKTRGHTNARATSGTFRVGEEMIRFRTVLHRPIAAAAVVKRATWLGRHHPTRGWQWAIAITCEEPHPTAPAQDCRRVGALDLGWRVIDEGVLRIGMLYDGARHYELRLPLEMPNYRSRRHGWRSSFFEVVRLQQESDALLERAKAEVRGALPEIEELAWVQNDAAWSRARHGGLRGILKTLRERTPECPAVGALEAWLRESDRLRSFRLAILDGLNGRREWTYRNLAAWIATNFRALAVEGPLDLKRMAESGAGGPVALKASMKYRQWAGLSRLRMDIEQACAARCVALVEIDPMNTTRVCAECGALAEAGPKLVLRCPNGHEWDQDANAARNLFSQMKEVLEQGGQLRTSDIDGRHKRLEIPAILKAVTAEVHPE